MWSALKAIPSQKVEIPSYDLHDADLIERRETTNLETLLGCFGFAMLGLAATAVAIPTALLFDGGNEVYEQGKRIKLEGEGKKVERIGILQHWRPHYRVIDNETH